MKVDIFISDSGSRVGETLADTLRTKYPQAKINIIAVNHMWPGGKLSSSDCYKSCLQKGRHRLIKMIRGIERGLFSLNEKGVVRALEKRLDADRPDLVISATALIGSSVLKAANKNMIPSIILTDIDPRLSLFHWENSSTPHRIALPFSSHEITSKLPTTINPNNVKFVGNPSRKEFRKPYSSEEISQFRRELHLPEDKKIISIAMGSSSSDYVSHLISFHQHKKIATPVHYAVICGNNKARVQQLLKGFKEISPMTFASEDGSLSFSLHDVTDDLHKYTETTSRIGFWQTRRLNFAFEEGRPIFGDKYSLPSSNAKIGMPGQPKPILEIVSVYLACSAAVITKPDQAAICEAIELGIPLIPSRIGGMLEEEAVGAEIIDQYSLGKPVTHWKELAETVNALLDPQINDALRNRIANFKEQKEGQFDFSRNFINLTESLLQEAGEVKSKSSISPSQPSPKENLRNFAKQISQALITIFKSLGNLFFWPFKEIIVKKFFVGFRVNNHAERLQRRKKLLEQGAIPIEGLFSSVSNKAIDALYIKSTAPHRTGNLIIYSVPKFYQNSHPQNYAPYLEGGADVLLFNPSANTTTTMAADLKQLIEKLKEKNPDQKISIYGHCLAGHVAASVACDFNDPSVSFIFDRSFGDGYQLVEKVTPLAYIPFIASHIQNNFNLSTLQKIGNFKGRVLFISTKQGKDHLLHTNTRNITREYFQLWSNNKSAEHTQNAYIELPKGACHWSTLDLETQTRIDEFLKEEGIIATLPKLDPKAFHPPRPESYFNRNILPLFLRNPYSKQPA
jgi:hypothetical protein